MKLYVLIGKAIYRFHKLYDIDDDNINNKNDNNIVIIIITVII